MRKYSQDIRLRALNLYVNGNSTRKVADILGIDQKTILNWATAENVNRNQSEGQSGKLNPHYGKARPDEVKRKISEAQKGCVFSEEHKQKLRLSRRKYLEHRGPLSEEVRAKLGGQWRGKHLPLIVRLKMSFAQRGSKSSRWKGGITSINDKIRASILKKRWRKIILKRDGYNCQICHSHGGYLEVHHKTPLSKIIEKNHLRSSIEILSCSELWDMDNALTLCLSCHKSIDVHRN